MWDLLKKADIDQANHVLNLRRVETLRRHAEESQNLDADRVELETLNKLVDIFVQNLQKFPIVSHAPISPPISTQNSGGKTSAEARHQHQRHQHQTVFASFMRAASRG
jgi:hypothetical protein